MSRGLVIAALAAAAALGGWGSVLLARAPEAQAHTTGRYQLDASSDAAAWIVLDTESGRFERWRWVVDKYVVETGQFGSNNQTDSRYVRAGEPHY